MKKFFLLVSLFFTVTTFAQTDGYSIHEHVEKKGNTHLDTTHNFRLFPPLYAPCDTCAAIDTAFIYNRYLSGIKRSNDSVFQRIGTTWYFVFKDSTGGGSGGGAIGSTITSGTPKSVLYIGTNGLLQQSNSDFFYDSLLRRMTVGPTGTPTLQAVLNIKSQFTTLNNNPDFAIWQKNASHVGGGMKIDSTTGDWLFGGLNGSNWYEVFRITNNSQRMGVGGAPSHKFHVVGGDVAVNNGQYIQLRADVANFATLGYSSANEEVFLHNYADGNTRYTTLGGKTPGGVKQIGIAYNNATQNVTIGARDGESKSVFTIESTTKVFMPPRMTQAQRNAIGVGAIATGNGSTTGGSGYTNGTYTGISLTGGLGSGAVATITVSGGIVASVVITSGGSGYGVGDVLTATGFGAGSGFAYTINTMLSIGGEIFCTDCTATDGSTGVKQTWVRSGTWKNHW